MDTRREFLRKASLLAGAGGLANMLPETIQRALAIDPVPGSTYLDAEHVVFLMQENRSFDHCFGTLRGVRGFNDPRALVKPDGHSVFVQKNAAGESYAPFRMNIKDTKATWMSALPHAWADQVDASNNGKHDRWLDAKRSGNKEYEHMPLTMGYYTREDIPFYYAMADAFTVCDQHFSSALTGTTPNRLYFWTGTIRQRPNAASKANVWNADVDYGQPVSWSTFPEILEEYNVSWKVYQNEISAGVGFDEEQDAWLANFTDNPLEWFSQYHVEYADAHLTHMQKLADTLPDEIAALKAAGRQAEAGKKESTLHKAREVLAKIEKKPYDQLPARERALHEKAFTTNANDPFYHELTSHQYKDGEETREVKLPKGDILHQFREDVNSNKLPAVSWIVAPENFSDHPGAPWYGAWYVSEVLDILTQRPEIWKKTIFVLTYDENDGYFDHIPPFTVPEPGVSTAGKVSKGIDTAVEYVTQAAQEPGSGVRESAIGLGYRVPMIVASPWSRGGWVNSQVFDHTSNLRFLEKFLSHKLKTKIATPHISNWRRTVCGDLTSVFRQYKGERIGALTSVDREQFIETLHKARFRQLPANFKKLSAEEIDHPAWWLPQQEAGTRTACALPYQLYAEARLGADRRTLELQLAASNEVFGIHAAGAPFNVYHHDGARRAYAVTAGDRITDVFSAGSKYNLSVYGPNGFYREMKGSSADPLIDVSFEYARVGKRPNGNGILRLQNRFSQAMVVNIIDNSYGEPMRSAQLGAGLRKDVPLNFERNSGWYDFTIKVFGITTFERRYAGHIETGSASISDPHMGRLV